MKKELILLKEQNQILKDLNDINNKLIDTLKQRSIVQEQMIVLLKQKIEMFYANN